MKEIFKYKGFSSSEEFENWQKESPRNIKQISPVIQELSLTENEGGHETNKIHFGVFCIYYEVEETKPTV